MNTNNIGDNKEYKQISANEINWRKRNPNVFTGKVIEKIALLNEGEYDEQMLIITFTDKTFICIGMEYKDDVKCDEMYLEDHFLNYMHSDSIKDLVARYHTWVNKETNELEWDALGSLLLEFGFIKLTSEEAKQIKEHHEKVEKDREYQQYLRLKEKFESEKQN